MHPELMGEMIRQRNAERQGFRVVYTRALLVG